MVENLLQEETTFSLDDLKLKVKKLEGYLKRAGRRINSLEKKLAKVEQEMTLAKKKVVA